MDIDINLTFHSGVIYKPLGPSQGAGNQVCKPNAGLGELSGVNLYLCPLPPIIFMASMCYQVSIVTI